MDAVLLRKIDTEILFLLRDMNFNKNDLPHKKELIKIKSLLKKISFDKDFGFNDDREKIVGVPAFSESEVTLNTSKNDLKIYSKAEMEYVFLEASLFLDVILNALISNYFDNKPIDGAEPKDGSRLPVELSVLIWYGNLLEDIYNKRLIHDSIGTNLIRLNRYKTEFENKKLEVLKDSAGAVFMKSIAENIRGRKSKV